MKKESELSKQFKDSLLEAATQNSEAFRGNLEYRKLHPEVTGNVAEEYVRLLKHHNIEEGK